MNNLLNSNQIKDDVSLLKGLKNDVVAEIANFACAYILHGGNKKIIKALGQSVEIEPTEIESCATAVATIFINAVRSNTNPSNVCEKLNISAANAAVLDTCFENNKEALNKVLQLCESNEAQYRALHWRMESQLASRSQLSTHTPRAVLQLDLTRNGQIESIALSSDIPNIIHWSQMIEQALAEARTRTARKLQRIAS